VPILARDKLGATLTNEDASGRHKFATEPFYAQPLADAVTSIPDAALTFLCAITYRLISFILTTVNS
jgi:hypothetical protein